MRLSFWRTVSCIAGIVLTAGAAPPRGDVWPNLHALPNRIFLETIQTLKPQTVVVTVVRGAAVVARIESRPKTARELAHHIAIPPLPGGLYEVQLRCDDATAVQSLSVSTISVLVAHSEATNVLMAFDLRTLHQRRDVRAIVATVRGLQVILPSRDGLIRVPSGVRATVTASDGSIVELSVRRFDVTGSWYLQTDREVYRPGDRVRYRFISHQASATISGDFGVRIGSAHHLGWGSFVIPSQTMPGRYLWDAITVTGAPEPPYRIEVAPWPYEADAEQPTGFVISATNAGGSPAAGLTLRYDTNVLRAPRETHLDPSGNAMVWMQTPYGQDLDFSIYEPGTQRIAAESWAHVNWQKEMIDVFPPMLGNPNACYAIAVTRQDAYGNPVARQPMTFAGSTFPFLSARPASVQHIVTGSGGLAIVRWCVPEGVHAYGFEVADNPPGQLRGRGAIQITDNVQNAQEQIWAFPDRPQTPTGVPINVTATSMRDADALVAAGSRDNPHVFVVPFREGVGHFQLAPQPESDEIAATIKAGTPGGEATGNTFVGVRPPRHRLMAVIGCLHDLTRICVRIADARGRPMPARLFVDVHPTTLAAVVKQQTSLLSEPAYSALFADAPWPVVSTPWGGGLETPPVSYLYPPGVSGAARAAIVRRASTTPHSEVMPSLPPLVWFDDVPTNRGGGATLALSAKFVARQLYSIHVIAVGADGDVGEAYAWTSR